MLSDNHMHTRYSPDSDAEPEQMILAAIEKGMKTICITDHMDKDYYVDGKEFVFDLFQYKNELQALKEKYQDRIKLRIGVELGLQPHLQEFCRTVCESISFDFVIGSTHVAKGRDPYFPEFYQGRRDEDAYREVLVETLENIKKYQEFDSLGHLDYMVRYGKYREKEYSYKLFADEIDEILRFLIENGKGLEVNAGGLKYGLPFAHPHPDVLRRYRELGGEIITIGSDAHKPEHVGYDFSKVRDMLISLNFMFCTEFFERKPIFSKIC